MARSTTETRAFKIFMDEPPELGGRDGAPSPLEMILAAHGRLPELHDLLHRQGAGLDIRGTEVEIEATLDPGKFAGRKRDVRAGYRAVNVTIKVHSDATPEQLERLRREVEARCPVSDNIANPTPVNIDLRRI